MNGKLVIAVVGALALALAGYVLLSDRGASGSGKPAASAAPSRPGSPDVARLAPDPSGKTPEVTPEEARAIRLALEKAASAGGAAKGAAPAAWSKPVVEAETRSCQDRAQSFVPPGTPGGAERACACALPVLQKLYPQGPPDPRKRREARDYERAMKGAIDDCTSMPR